MSKKIIIVAILVIVLITIAGASTYIVQQRQESLPAPIIEGSLGPPREWQKEDREIVADLSWYEVEGAVDYRVYRATNPNGPWQVFPGIGSQFDDEQGRFYVWSDLDLPQEFTFLYYYVVAIDKKGKEGKPSNILELKPFQFEITVPSQLEIDTSDWKVYRNEKYGFELKYPKEYDDYEDCKLKETENGIELGGGNFRIEIIDAEGVSLEDYVDEFVYRMRKEFGILGLSEEELARRNIWIDSTRVLVGKREGFEVNLPGRPSSFIFLSKDGLIFEISWRAIGVTSCLGYEHPKGPMIDQEIPNERDLFEQLSNIFQIY